MMMMITKSRRKEVDEDDKKKGGHEKEETRLKESQPTCRRPRSTLPASVNTWRPTIANDCAPSERCFIAHTLIVREINVEPFPTCFRTSIRQCESSSSLVTFTI